ncbi:MAG: hypothetical protein QOJ94_1422 [Sphingomonadales bacterium]|jgi:hypothetical protein|nr:hypothetical protein [Sphingomonadales bacterium]
MKAAFLAAAALGGTAALLGTVPAAAQSDRIARVVVYGNDPCPTSASGDEVVICARRPERERYRIPKELRDRRNGGENPSWAERAESLEYVGRTGAQSCSTVGPGGFTGCWGQMIRAYRKDRTQGHTGEEPAPDK